MRRIRSKNAQPLICPECKSPRVAEALERHPETNRLEVKRFCQRCTWGREGKRP